MSHIVGIGACVMDTLINVPYYPDEDTKLCARSFKSAGGGPVATGLVAATKLGESTEYIGVLADDSAGNFLYEDFKKYGVDTCSITVENGYRSFSSVILLSDKSSTRTCVFYRGTLPPLKLNSAQKQSIKSSKLLMVDGNELDAALEATKIAKANGIKVLYDCGGLYDNVEKLLSQTDIMIPSEEFAMKHTGLIDAHDAAKCLYDLYSPEIVVVTQGKRGGFLYDGKRYVSYPAYPAEVVDSNGSGDVFHGAFAAGIMKGYDYVKCCHFASAVSALKCTGIGARESVPDFNTVKNCLKENGYEL